MSFTLNSLAMKVFLPIIVGVAILGTLQSMKATSLDPQVDSVQDALGQLDRSFVLADSTDGDNLQMSRKQKARHEFRQAIIFNMFTAQHCSFIPMIDEMPQNTGFSGLKKGEVFYPQKLHKKDTDQKVGVFEVLKKEDELPLSCVGSGNLLEQVPNTLSDFVPDIFNSDSETSGSGNDMEGRYGRINFEVVETFRLQDPRVGGTNFKGDPGDSLARGDLPDLWRGDRMISMLPAGMTYDADKCGGVKQRETKARNGVRLYKGETGANWVSAIQDSYDEIFVAAGATIGNSLGGPAGSALLAAVGSVAADQIPDPAKVINYYGGESEGLYAYRVRMAGMPMYKKGAMVEDYGTLTFCGLRNVGAGTMKRFLIGDVPYNHERNNVEYVMCNGTQGYIQSNAGGLEQGAEAADSIVSGFYGGNPEAIVFPVVQVTASNDCLASSNLKFIKMGDEDQNNKIISPRIDLDNDGQREACSLEDVRNLRNETWEGLTVSCALTKKRIFQPSAVSERKHEYYTTVWYARDDSCQVKKAEITEMFHARGDFKNDRVYTPNGNLMMKDGTGALSANYEMSTSSDIDKLYIDYNVEGSKTALNITPVKGKSMTLVYADSLTSDTDFNNPWGKDIQLTDDTKWDIIFGQKPLKDPGKYSPRTSDTPGSQVEIDLENDRIEWSTDDRYIEGEFSGIPDSISSINLRSNREHSAKQTPGTTKVESIAVSGDLC